MIVTMGSRERFDINQHGMDFNTVENFKPKIFWEIIEGKERTFQCGTLELPGGITIKYFT
jgi:hypothetical protein